MIVEEVADANRLHWSSPAVAESSCEIGLCYASSITLCTADDVVGDVLCGVDVTIMRGAMAGEPAGVGCCCGAGDGDFFDKFNGCAVSAMSTCSSRIRGDGAADGD